MRSLSRFRYWWLALVAALIVALPGWSEPDETKVVAPNRNLVNTRDKNISLDFSLEEGKERNILWKARLGKESYGGPVVAGGKVFVGTNNENPRDPTIQGDHGVLMCFDARTGAFLWQATHEKFPDNAQNFPMQGIASTPYVDGERVYYVSNRGELVCADINGDLKQPGKAKILWSLDMRKELKIFVCKLPFSSPLIVDDQVYIVTGNGRDSDEEPPWKLPSPDAPSFIAVNKKSGKLVWKDASPNKNIMEGSWASPAYANPRHGKPQVIFPGGDGWLYAFEPLTGKLIWKFDCNPKSAVFNPKLKNRSEKAHFFAAPVIWEDRAYIAVGCNPDDGPGVGHLWCIDLTKTGDVSPVDDVFDAGHPKNKDSALVWHQGGKIVPEPERGRKFHFGRTLSTPAIHDGLLYIGELDGYLFCFDARTGKRHWVVDQQASLWSSPYWVDGKIFLGNEDGDVHVYAHGKEMKQLAKLEIGPSIKNPIKVADGILYILTRSDLYAIGKKR